MLSLDNIKLQLCRLLPQEAGNATHRIQLVLFLVNTRRLTTFAVYSSSTELPKTKHGHNLTFSSVNKETTKVINKSYSLQKNQLQKQLE